MNNSSFKPELREDAFSSRDLQDLIFIGGGLSCTLTLTYLLRHLLLRPNGLKGRRLKIVMVDANGDFGSGYPYGRLAYPWFLLNETAATMNVCGFIEWLSANRKSWVAALESCDHPAVRGWLSANRDALVKAEHEPVHYSSLYFPRCIFGSFLQDVLTQALAQQQECGLARVVLVKGKVSAISRTPNRDLRLLLADGKVMYSRRIILGLGSSSPKAMPHLENAPGYTHDLFREGSGPALAEKFHDTFSPAVGRKIVALIGSNAAAMESLYVIRNTPAALRCLDRIVVISPSGFLPDAVASGLHFEARHLQALTGRGKLNASELFLAASQDVADARRLALSPAEYSPRVCHTFRKLFTCLSSEERRCFVEEFGAQFTALNRHTPPEYSAATRELRAAGMLQVVRGHVHEIARDSAYAEFRLDVRGPDQARTQFRAQAIINCSGAGPLHSTSSQLLATILQDKSGIARMNSSNKGILVTENFEASDGVYVMGPLLAGHSGIRDWIWNLESAPRIEVLALRLADTLASELGRVELPAQHELQGDRASQNRVADTSIPQTFAS